MPSLSPVRPYALPAATYFKACRSLLNRRIVEGAGVMLVFVYTLVLLFQARLSQEIFGTLSSLVSFKTIWYTTTIYIPLTFLLIARKVYMSVERSVQPSLFLSICWHLTNRKTWVLLGLYMLSGIMIGLSYYGMHAEKYISNLFLYPEGRYGVAQLSEQMVFIMLHSLGLGAAYAIYHLAQERDYLRFSIIQQTRYWAIKGRLPTVAAKSAYFAGYAFAAAYLFYFFFGRIVYKFEAGFLGHFFTLLRSPVIRFRWFDLHLFLRTFSNGLLAVTCWELLDHVFDVFFTEPVYVTDAVLDSNGCLASGLKLADKPYFRALAFLELYNITKYNPQRRIMLFRDIVNAPTAWEQISQECIKVVNELTIALENEFKKPEEGPSSATLPIPDSPTPLISGGSKLSAISTDIFVVKKETSWFDKFKNPALPDSKPSLIDTGADMLLPDPVVPDIFRQPTLLKPSTDKSPFKTPAQERPASLLTDEARRQGVEYTKKQVDQALVWLKTYLEGWVWGRVLFANTIERRTHHLFRNLQVQAWAIQALSGLTAASYREDQYGSVQRDIPKVIECLLACLMATESYLQRPPLGAAAGGIKTNPHQVLMREPHAMVQVLHGAIYEIVATFYEHLSEFKFPPKYASKLQGFVDFKE